MRLFVAVVAGCVLLASRPMVGGEAFPYRARVNSEDACARSGPGQRYYPTDRLKAGDEVEVYQHSQGGWSAVRPVAGSFSWVSTQYLEPTEKNLAVVTDDNVPARIGSCISEICDVVQVRLRKGEVVEILDIPPRDASSGAEIWARISPPPGEFRWIAAKDLAPLHPADGEQNAPTDSEATGNPSSTPDAADAAVTSRQADVRALSQDAYLAELERLELELSALLLEEPAVWAFDSLRDRASLLLDQAHTAVERGRARLLANRIARFEDIKQRYASAATIPSRADRPAQRLAALRPESTGNRNSTSSDLDDRFDGVGQLTRVTAAKLGAPRYALLNEAGDVRCYVTPAPGVNLQGYVGKDVGVTGTRGYIPEQRASHLIARHVTPLEGNLLR